MRKTVLILIPVALVLILSACTKSGSSRAQGLNGTWIFLGMTGQSLTTGTQAGVTTKANAIYVTKGNTGTIRFNNDSMVASGLGFSVDTSVTAYFYYNNALYDSTVQAINFFIPPTSNSAKYMAIGSDSLYFPNGGILSALDSASTGQGSRYLLKGDSLTLMSQAIDTSGGAFTVTNTTINLRRQ